MRARALILSLLTTTTMLAGAIGAAHPDGDDGGDPGQHGPSNGHLPASSRDVEVVGRLGLTAVPGGIADVAAHEGFAYLAAFSPECAGRPGALGTGVHVVDISTPELPVKVGFLPAEVNSYVGEGVHIFEHAGRDILVHNNETCDSTHPVVSGFAVWDVTTPTAPVKLAQSGDTNPAVTLQTYHTTHSVQGFSWGGRAYAVAQDNQESRDVDIFDITPALSGGAPFLVSEVGLNDWPGAQGLYANGDTIFHHDMQQKVIDGHNFLLVSYWDAGQVLLNIDNPASPVFVTDSDFSRPDPETSFGIPEGNSHQSYWDQDGRFVLSTDEDFSPARTLFNITAGPNAGPYGAGEFSWTKPIGPSLVAGNTIFGGSGCTEDLNGNGTSDRNEVPSASSTGARFIVFSRGECFFSVKVESGTQAGYDAVIVGNSHLGSRAGLVPDAFSCGGKGHAFDSSNVYGICIGHRAMHLLFGDPAGYTAPEGYEAGGDLPPIGTHGEAVSATTSFDGWGYLRLHDADTLAEIDTYAIPESIDPAYATGFGHLTVHEVKTDPRPGIDLAYASWYSGGLRVLSFDAGGLTEVGHYIADGGSNLWGVFPVKQGQALKDNPGLGRGRHGEKRPLILASDRDSGLWIFRYTGRERRSEP